MPAGEKIPDFLFCIENLVECGIFDEAAVFHTVPEHFEDFREGNLFLEELLHRIFIRRVEGSGNISAFSDCLIGEAQGGEGLHIRLFESDLPQRIEIQFFTGHGAALRVVEGVLDGKAHIRNPQLRDDPAVLVLHHGVDDALGMDQDLYLRWVYIKQPLCLDDLQALVDEGGRIDRDLPPHFPGGMPEGVCWTNRLEILRGTAAEGAA